MLEPGTFNLSVCICTRNRPNEILRALESLSAMQRQVHEVIVSDDSTDDETYDIVINADFALRYVRGPKRGLSANRNNALRLVGGTHVLFIDDDVVVHPEFIQNIIRYYEGIMPQRRPKVIVTGLESKHGELVFPHEQSFLGFQEKVYVYSAKIRTIVINSTVFPATLFASMHFDENLVYGYEEVDMATRASYAGFDIEICTTAVNNHYPSDINRDFYRPYLHASRLYVTFKRYFHSERRPMKAALFAVVAICHLLASSFLHRGPSGVYNEIQTVRLALAYLTKPSKPTPAWRK